MAPRTGKQYVDALKDGREVWLNGRRLKDVTEEPLLRPAIDATAQLYDMQRDTAHVDLLTAESEWDADWPHLSGASDLSRPGASPKGDHSVDGTVVRLSWPIT